MLGLILWSVLVFSLAPMIPAFGQNAKLIEEAKKEGGKVIRHGSLEAQPFDAVQAAFQKKTGLELEYWRGSGTRVVDRAVSEYRAGKARYDVLLVGTTPAKLYCQGRYGGKV